MPLGAIKVYGLFGPPQWTLSSPFGIDMGEQGWVTGSVWAVHPLPDDRLLVGTEQGGLWFSERDPQGYSSRCLSNTWQHCSIVAFAEDPADANRIFVGCNDSMGASGAGTEGRIGAIYIGDAAHPDNDWTYVPLPLTVSGGIYSMIILPTQRLLVIATGVGQSATLVGPLSWASIDTVPFEWHSDPRTVTDLANLIGDDFLIADQSKSFLGRAQIAGGNLTLHPIGATDSLVPRLTSVINWNASPDVFTPLRVGSCQYNPANAYCLGYGTFGKDQRNLVIRTHDGGKTWSECQYNTENRKTPLTFTQCLRGLESTIKSRYSIAVHPTKPEYVAASHCVGLLSNDGGDHWFSIDRGGAVIDMAGWHADLHELRFDENTLFIPSDGGIVRIANKLDLIRQYQGEGSYPSDTRRNKTLPVLMFFDPGSNPRQFSGSMGVANGIVGAGAMDNGDLWLDPSTQVWHQYRSGDGGYVALYQQSSGTYIIGDIFGADTPRNNAVTCGRWQSGTWVESDIVPVVLGRYAIDGDGMSPIMRAVSPIIGLQVPASPPMRIMALAARAGNNVAYGAVTFETGAVPPVRYTLWIPLGSLPAGESITALEPFDNKSILVGTSSGRLFLIPLNATPVEIFFDPIKYWKFGHPYFAQLDGPVLGIASDGNTVVCHKGSDPTILFSGQLRYDRTVLYTRGTPRYHSLAPLDETAFPMNNRGVHVLRGLCANRNRIPMGLAASSLSFAITLDEREVWVCHSPFANDWRRLVDGLPTAVRCSDIIFSEFGELFLSTYGRSLWQLL